MERLKKIFKLARVLATSWTKNGKIKSEELTNLFTQKEADDIARDINLNKEERDVLIEEFKNQKDWKSIERKIKPKTEVRYLSWALRVASILVLAIGGTYLFNQINNSKGPEFDFASSDIVIKLDDGKSQVIHENGSYEIIDKNGEVVSNKNGKSLDYRTEASFDMEEISYNELFVPFGKTFKVVMSDSTVVTLNSGTKLKYPTRFSANSERKVFLEGEAYFDVYPDKERPFIVTATGVNVKVLGTEFNVSSYANDAFVKTVLVEGAVSLYDESIAYSSGNEILLHPGEKGSFGKKNRQIKVKKVDTAVHTAWLDGNLIFKGLQFNQIIKILERHYNVKIKNTNPTLGKQRFTATFNIESIQDVLDSFKLNYPFTYEVKENKININ
ncbi:FecR family protein [Wenyingzhuangia sp. IMCC45574]